MIPVGSAVNKLVSFAPGSTRHMTEPVFAIAGLAEMTCRKEAIGKWTGSWCNQGVELPNFEASEKYIENAILDWLAMNDIFAWKVQTVGIYDAKIKGYRKVSKRYMTGVADILGIYKGRPLAIEVKSAKGILSPHQKIFLRRFMDSGGIAILARSVSDVETGLHLAG